MNLRVRVGAKWLRWGGFVLLSVGAATTVSGAMFWALSSNSSGVRNNYKTAGIGMTFGGLAGIAGGIPMSVLGRTKVEFLPTVR